MNRLKKTKAMSDVKISFVSLVDKAANRRKFLVVKSDTGNRSTLVASGLAEAIKKAIKPAAAEPITKAEIQSMIDAAIRKATGEEEHYMHGYL